MIKGIAQQIKINCFPYLVEKLKKSISPSVLEAENIFTHPKATKMKYKKTKSQSIPAKILFFS